MTSPPGRAQQLQTSLVNVLKAQSGVPARAPRQTLNGPQGHQAKTRRQPRRHPGSSPIFTTPAWPATAPTTLRQKQQSRTGDRCLRLRTIRPPGDLLMRGWTLPSYRMSLRLTGAARTESSPMIRPATTNPNMELTPSGAAAAPPASSSPHHRVPRPALRCERSRLRPRNERLGPP